MAEPFLGEIRLLAFNFPPQGWAPCNGQMLPINQNQALFSLLGTVYGGNGQTTFGLPDFRGRMPAYYGQMYQIGQRGGEPAHTLGMSEMPAHNHATYATSAQATASTPSNTLALAQTQQAFLYSPCANTVQMANNSLTPYGNSQAHENMQPYMTLNFCIALVGIFPSQN
jgi:microcystin-dependent protein